MSSLMLSNTMFSQYHILCVDDEKILLDSLTGQIEHLFPDWVVHTAQSGQEALEVIHHLHSEKQEISILLTDLNMPGMRGDDLLIAAHKLIPRTVKLMMTGYPLATWVENAIQHAQLQGLIAKPWGRNDIHYFLEKGMNQYLTNHPIRFFSIGYIHVLPNLGVRELKADIHEYL